MVARRWGDLSERDRRLIMLAGAVDAVLRLAVLVDLRRRPAEQVRGSRRAWQAANAVVSSAGLLPLGYFLVGRRKHHPPGPGGARRSHEASGCGRLTARCPR